MGNGFQVNGRRIIGVLLVAFSANSAAADIQGEIISHRLQAWLQMPSNNFFETQAVGRAIQTSKIDHQLMAAALFHETNRRRHSEKKAPLRYDPRLDEAARMHAVSMAENSYLSHMNPYRPERRTPQDRARLAGFAFRYLSENVASHFAIRYEAGTPVYRVQTRDGTGFSYQPDGPVIQPHTYESFVASLLDQWMQSPEHRRNILAAEPVFFGSGCEAGQSPNEMEKLYCAQLFGTPQ